MGRSGFEAAQFLKKRGALVTVSEKTPEEQLGKTAAAFRNLGVDTEFGGHTIKNFLEAGLIVVSPGVPHTITPLLEAQAREIPVLGEIELASRFINEPIVAVTGTNGKTTTTRLIGEMLMQSGQEIYVGGNIGNPLIGYVDKRQKADCLVVEVSSFQLDTISTFKPHISLLLNISDDHLDRYSDLEAYARSKARILENQDNDDVAILNGSDNRIRNIIDKTPVKKLFFKGRQADESGTLIESQEIRFFGLNYFGNRNVDVQNSIDLSRVKLACRHDLENIAAASLATLAAGGDLGGIHKALELFAGLPHRMEFIGAYDGVSYYNDSKATNVDAVLKAIECLQKPIHLIMGGRDKEGRFELLTVPVRDKVKNLVLLGEAAPIIDRTLANCTNTHRVAGMHEAVRKTASLAASGETVLLSPGCASFDMYRDYKERGDRFRQLVYQVHA